MQEVEEKEKKDINVGNVQMHRHHRYDIDGQKKIKL